MTQPTTPPGGGDQTPVPTPVTELTAGMRVDLEGDPFATGEAFVSAEFEYAIVCGTERETPDCVRVDFEDLPSIGVPPGHQLPALPAAGEATP